METFLIGAVIIDTHDDEGMIVDKVRGYSDSTVYICVRKDGTFFEVDYDDLRAVVCFAGSPSIYITKTEK